MEHIIISCFSWWPKVSFFLEMTSNDLKMTWPYILVANQFWYVYCLYYMAWPPAGMETALAVFCCFGFCSGSFLIAIQLRCILRRGTQYFPGKSPPRKVFENFIGPFLKIQSYSHQLRNVLIFSLKFIFLICPEAIVWVMTCIVEKIDRIRASRW